MAFDTKAIRREVEYNTLRQSDAIPSLLIACKVIDDLRDEIDRLRGEQQTPQQQGKTVGVRIAVAIESRGHWSAEGWDGASDEAMVYHAKQSFDGESKVYWLTATLPVPEEMTVVAQVEND